MFAQSKTLGLAVTFAFVSGILQIAVAAMEGFTDLFLLGCGVLVLVAAYLLKGNRRWFTWISFFLFLGGSIVALGYATAVNASMLHLLIAILTFGIALMLFLHLWFPKVAVNRP